MRDLEPEADALATTRQALLAGVAAFAVGMLLFGDYLVLSLSRLLTGTANNWLLFVAVLQPLALAALLAAGGGRRRPPSSVVVGYCGLCVLALGHAVPIWLLGNELGEYGSQKLLALLFTIGPALGCGCLLGGADRLRGAQLMPWFAAPLLAGCVLSLVQDPRLLTIEHYNNPPIHFGFLVMPTHQPLAFCLAKLALLAFAGERATVDADARRVLRLTFVGAALGLVLLSGARSYAVALVAALAVQALLGGRRLALVLAGGAVALWLYQSYASDLVQDRFDPTRIVESLAYREREQAWQAAWDAFVAHPLFGVGAGGFAQAMGWHGRVYPHNLLLEVASEFGLIGLGCLAALFAVPLRHLLATLRQAGRPSVAAVFGFGLLVFAVGGAMAVGDLIRNHCVFFAIGMCATLAPVPTPEAADVPAALPEGWERA